MEKASKSNNYHYNKKLKPLANANRKNMTKSAACTWKYLLGSRQMLGYQFRRARPILDYIVDFVCLDLLLVIEIDGITHESEEAFQKDSERDAMLKKIGFTTLRFSSWEILNNITEVGIIISEWIKEHTEIPPPAPPLEGDIIAVTEENVDYVVQTKNWIQEFVIGLNLCPFARKPFTQDKIRYILEETLTEEEIIKKVLEEAIYLAEVNTELTETSVLIFPDSLTDFETYLDIIYQLEYLLKELKLEGRIQIATFHPAYQFEGTEKDAVENFTNRSPYPLVHLLREDVVSAAVEHYPNPEVIPEENIQKMKELGIAGIQKILKSLKK